MVCTFGAPGSPPGEMVEAMRVSHTACGIDRDVHRPRQVDAAKHDAGVGRRGPNRELDLLAAVHAHADRAGERLQGALRQHDAIVGRRRRLRPRGGFGPAARAHGAVPPPADRPQPAAGSIGLLPQKGRDLDLVHAVGAQRLHLGRRLRPVAAPHAGRGVLAVVGRGRPAAVLRAVAGYAPCCCCTGTLSVPVRCTAFDCTTVSGVWTLLACDRPVAITVTRNWSPSVSSKAAP